MMAIFLIYFVGKAFYDLANEHNKSKWGFAVLGVISYYACGFLGSGIIGIVLEINDPGSVETMNPTLLGLMGLPFGILACWGFYKLLKRNWERKPTQVDDSVLDSGFIDNATNP